MNNYPIEKQVCSLEQAKELAELLEGDAPGSYFLWVEDDWRKNVVPVIISGRTSTYQRFYPAYTGDELACCLYKHLSGRKMPYSAKQKADLAIQGLKESWIKPEEFKFK